MYPELHRELYKLSHRKLTWWMPVIMIGLMIIMGLAMGRDYSNLLVMTCYNSSDIIMLILVILGSTIFSTEFQNNTILALIYHSSSKLATFMAKYIALFIYNVALHLLAIVFTILLNIIPLLNAPVSWTGIYKYHQPLVVNMLATTGIDIITSTLIISLLCLFSCLINSDAIVIAINAIIIFMGRGFSASLLNANLGIDQILKWNPLNMTNLTTQYYNYASYHPTSMLSNSQLFWGTCCYIILISGLGYLAFRRKRF
ncbi:ABC transporter permease [Limosilactobacillus sp. c9Ua_26_M]|uniref:ABC transporter permease n=2 Tax=Limosilactobacillus TaxID=2742598 RepID=A0ABR8ZIE3_9LACO|nr:ABC transporter permease [Limosilactobacillus urinaemulieris]MBD8085057.1 ABC transporter permease [Limosilactobacillus urinaemulieris]